MLPMRLADFAHCVQARSSSTERAVSHLPPLIIPALSRIHLAVAVHALHELAVAVRLGRRGLADGGDLLDGAAGRCTRRQRVFTGTSSQPSGAFLSAAGCRNQSAPLWASCSCSVTSRSSLVTVGGSRQAPLRAGSFRHYAADGG